MQKYKVHISSESLPDKEIAPFKDFETLLKKRKSALLARQFTRLSVTFFTVGLLIGAYFYFSPETKDLLPIAEISTKPEPIPAVAKIETPVIQQQSEIKTSEKSTTEVSESHPINLGNEDKSAIKYKNENKIFSPSTERVVLSEKANNIAQKPSSLKTESPKGKPELEKEEVETNSFSVFTKPEPTVGFDGLFAFFAKEMKLPETSAPIKGLVLVSFAINETGQPEDIKVEKSLSETHDTEALRLIRQMPLWTPALANGRPVKTRVAVPVRF